MQATAYPHIEQAENGTLYVTGTPYKVKMLVLEHIAWGMDAREISQGHTGLTLSDAHAVLAYFYDNEAALRQEIKQEFDEVEVLRTQAKPQISREALIDRLAAMDSGSDTK